MHSFLPSFSPWLLPTSPPSPHLELSHTLASSSRSYVWSQQRFSFLVLRLDQAYRDQWTRNQFEANGFEAFSFSFFSKALKATVQSLSQQTPSSNLPYHQLGTDQHSVLSTLPTSCSASKPHLLLSLQIYIYIHDNPCLEKTMSAATYPVIVNGPCASWTHNADYVEACRTTRRPGDPMAYCKFSTQFQSSIYMERLTSKQLHLVLRVHCEPDDLPAT